MEDDPSDGEKKPLDSKDNLSKFSYSKVKHIFSSHFEKYGIKFHQFLINQEKCEIGYSKISQYKGYYCCVCYFKKWLKYFEIWVSARLSGRIVPSRLQAFKPSRAEPSRTLGLGLARLEEPYFSLFNP
jgi:hypothetical protein